MSSNETTPGRFNKRRWGLRIGLLVLLVVVAAGGFFAYKFNAASRIPDFYNRQRLEGDDRLQAIASVERKFGNFQGSLGDAIARERRAADPSEADEERLPVTLDFTGDELDTYFNKWLSDNSYSDAFASHLSEPRLLLDEGKLILAGRATLPWVGETVVSMHFLPNLNEESGRAELALQGVYAGVAALPDGAIEPLRTKAAQSIEARLPGYVEDAAFEEDGTANAAAVDLAVDRQLARLLAQQPVADLVLFPYLVGRGHVATRVQELTIEDGVLRLSVLPLTEKEREAYLAAIKQGPADDVSLAEMDDA